MGKEKSSQKLYKAVQKSKSYQWLGLAFASDPEILLLVAEDLNHGAAVLLVCGLHA